MRKSNVALFAPFLLMVFLYGSPAFSQIQVRVRMIEASNRGSTVDPSLRDVHNELGSLFNFTSYRLLRDQHMSLTDRRPIDISPQREFSLEIFLLNQTRNMGEFRIRVRKDRKEILNTQVRLMEGRTVVIGGPKYGDGTIILAISAHF